MGNSQTTNADGVASENPVIEENLESVEIPDFTPGEAVTTPYGLSSVDSVREDGIVIVRPLTWLIATGKPPIFYMNAKDVKPFAESVEIDQVVKTPYGVSVRIEGVREDGIIVVQPKTWALATGKPPIFYMNAKDVKPCFDEEITPEESAVVIEEAVASAEETTEGVETSDATPDEKSESSPTVSSEAAQASVEAVAEATAVLSLAEPASSSEPVPEAIPVAPAAPTETGKEDAPAPSSPAPPPAPAAEKTPVSPMRRRGSFSVLTELELGLSAEMFVVKPELAASEAAKEAVLATGKDLLIGWQIQLTDVSGSDTGIRVITGSKKLALQPTQFSLASSATDDQKTWSYLKRTKDKTGLSFKLLRKVMEVQA